MKKILIAAIIPLLFSCSAKDAEKGLSKEDQLKKYKSELAILKKKISGLEKEIKSEGNNEETINVVVTELTNSKFEHFIQVTGNVEADKNITITPEANGNIISIDVVEGQKVKKGDVLGKLNTAQIQRGIDEVRTKLNLATTIFERQERLWNQKIGSEIEYLQAKANKESLERNLEGLEAQKELAIITAPFNGIIDEIHQKKGELASPTIPFAQLVNIDQVYVEADVAETYLNYIKAGENAELEFPAIGYNTNAPIYRTSNIIDPGNRSFKVRINLNNPGHKIKPNLISVLKIKDYEIDNAIVVPSIIVKKDFEGNYLYVAKKEGKNLVARKTYIQILKTYNNLSLVESGVQLGDKIITEGYSQVVNGTLISTK
ncbi:MAG: efflux RND transporter periplasmic adaptor subunit [Marinifilum sp.]|jgi:RND family efflux transporter MFP subunit|nr:efflux RND transporter periplasmic adaptor subunit [Marinifilum sp.]